jgi:toxin FitB
MNIVDSCGWLEYFADGKNAGFFTPPILDIGELLVPGICVYEVFRKVFNEFGERAALNAIAIMYQGTILELDADLAVISA